MPTYKIFISGPSDVNEYIDITRDVIREINLIAGPIGFQFESFDWLESVTPGIGTEPQAIINEQAVGYSAIIAIIGARLGSPTAGYDSGTVEEIERAIEISDKLPFGSKSVMVFFKDTQLDIKTADLSSAVKVQELRSLLGGKGILYKDFSDVKSFRDSLFRSFGVVISKRFGEGAVRSVSNDTELAVYSVASVCNTSGIDISIVDDVEELGIIDLSDLQADLMGRSTGALEKISSAMNDLTSFMEEKTPEITAYGAAGDQKSAKRVFLEVAESMNYLSSIIDENAPIVGSSFERSVEYLKSMIEISSSDFPRDDHSAGIEELRSVIVGMLDAACGARDSISSYMSSLSSMPRMTKELNAARRNLTSSSDRYYEITSGIISDIESMITILNGQKA